jgi:hypothetical protein
MLQNKKKNLAAVVNRAENSYKNTHANTTQAVVSYGDKLVARKRTN